MKRDGHVASVARALGKAVGGVADKVAGAVVAILTISARGLASVAPAAHIRAIEGGGGGAGRGGALQRQALNERRIY